MNDTYIAVVVVLIIIGILVVWYLSRNMYKISEKKLLHFESDEVHLQPWLEAEIPKKFKVYDPQETAKLFLEKAFGRIEEESYLAIATNIYEKYYNLYGEEPPLEDFYDLRELIGVNCQILVCPTRKIADRLLESNDYSRVADILEQPRALEMIREYLTKTMDWRWKRIRETFPGRSVRTGSYLYLPPEMIISATVARNTSCGLRYNLLGDEREFMALLERAEKVMKMKRIK